MGQGKLPDNGKCLIRSCERRGCYRKLLKKKELIEMNPLASKSRSKVVLTLHRFRASESGSGSPRSNDCLFISFDLIASLDSMGE